MQTEAMQRNPVIRRRTAELRRALIDGGACLVGFADVSSVTVDMTRDFPFGICFALQYDQDAVEQLPCDEPFLVMKSRLGVKARELYQIAGGLLDGWGYSYRRITSPIPPDDLTNLSEELPQKTIATLSGLGWIGRSSQLVSPHFGPRVRLGTLLTNGPLLADTPITESRCDQCTACVEVCPVGAIKGAAWAQGVSRDELLDVSSCYGFLCETIESLGRTQVCGLCVKACPIGRSAANPRWSKPS